VIVAGTIGAIGTVVRYLLDIPTFEPVERLGESILDRP
jgi:hypothetical protein